MRENMRRVVGRGKWRWLVKIVRGVLRYCLRRNRNILKILLRRATFCPNECLSDRMISIPKALEKIREVVINLSRRTVTRKVCLRRKRLWRNRVMGCYCGI